MIGQTVSHYRILSKLGEGGMGAVYLAQDTSLERRVALKFLSAGTEAAPAGRARLLREARAAAALEHSGICTVYEVGEHEDRLFIAMAWIEGRTLRDLIAERPLPVAQAVDLAVQCAQALGAAHRRGIVHRDIKSGNIMVDQEGQAKIVDFGLAKLPRGEALTRSGVAVGTCTAMSPEQTRGDPVDQRTDIWSLGVVLYQMLTGQLPFQGAYDQAVLYAVLNEAPRPPSALRPDVPARLDAIVLRCLCKDPAGRYPQMSDLVAALRGEDAQPRWRAWLAALLAALARVARRLPRAARWATAGIAAAALLAWALLGGGGRPFASDGLRFAERSWLVVEDFANRTGEETWPSLVREALLIDLGQSPYVNILTGRLLAEALERMGQSATARLDSTLGLQIAVREGARAVLEGTISRSGQGYHLEARLVSPATGAVARTVRARARTREDMLGALDDLARGVRRGLGENWLSVRRRDEPLARVSTASLTALQAYTRGNDLLSAARWQEAITEFEAAVQLDTTFAMALAKLGRTYFVNGGTADAERCSARARRHLERVSERERYYIEAEMRRQRSDYAGAIAKYEVLAQLYPDDFDARINLATACVLDLRYEAALTQAQAAARIAPDSWYTHHILGVAYGGVGNYAAAIDELRRALSVNPKMQRSREVLSIVYACAGDIDQAWSELQTMAAGGEGSVDANYRLAKFEVFLGRHREAMGSLRAALAAAARQPGLGLKAWIRQRMGAIHRAAGEADSCLADYRASAELWPAAQSLFFLGASCAQFGHAAEAADTERRLAAIASQDSSELNRTFLSRLRGEIAYWRGDYAAAAQCFQAAMGTSLDLESSEGLARALAGQGRLREAIEQYERIVANRYTAFHWGVAELWPLALCRLGDLYAQAGDAARCRECDRQFLNLWRRADPDRPEPAASRERLLRAEA